MDRLIKMTTEMTPKIQQYCHAVGVLNSLQSNAQIIEDVRKNRDQFNINSIRGMDILINRIGMNKDSLFTRLKCIHIVGTKGKGSCAATCESILRNTKILDKSTGKTRYLRTGLFTSPHLIEVRERIRINGKPMAKGLLAKYLLDVHNRLKDTAPESPSILNPQFPAYFRFLTLVAFEAFVKENVDVAIIEAGVGGEYDSTNVVNPVVTGITSLGLDHLNLLGPTLKEIAWHKAGAMKAGKPAFSTIQTEEIATKTILERSKEIGVSSFSFVNPEKSLQPFINSCSENDSLLSALDTRNARTDSFGLTARYQLSNMALAVNLCNEWINYIHPRVIELIQDNGMDSLREMDKLDKFDNENIDYDIPPVIKKENLSNDVKDYELIYNESSIKEGLKSVKWPGRAQVYESTDYPNLKWFLDGAHTKESIPAGCDWFEETSKVYEPKDNSNKIKKILIFNCTKGRDSYQLLNSLVDLHIKYPFTKVIFSSIDCFKAPCIDSDSAISTGTDASNKEKLPSKRAAIPVDQMMSDGIRAKMMVSQVQMQNDWVRLYEEKTKERQVKEIPKDVNIELVPSIEEAIISASQEANNSTANVFVTGSLYLVGGILTVLGAPVV